MTEKRADGRKVNQPSIFRPLSFLRCVFDRGHEWTNSKSLKGYMTCRRCRIRRRWRGI